MNKIQNQRVPETPRKESVSGTLVRKLVSRHSPSHLIGQFAATLTGFHYFSPAGGAGAIPSPQRKMK